MRRRLTCWRGKGEKYLLCAAERESGGCHGDCEVRKEKEDGGIDTYALARALTHATAN